MNRGSREELTGVLSLGLFSERMVLVLSRLQRGDELTDEDRRLLAVARRLFELMTQEEVIVAEQAEDRMLSDESYLDALHVVRLQTESGEIEPFARRYVTLLQTLIDGVATDQEREELGSLRDLFIELGGTTLSRADELSRTRQEPSWRAMHLTTSRS